MLCCRVIASAFALVLPQVLAQTYTKCNPLEKDCPASPGLQSSTFSTDFTSKHANWSPDPGTTMKYGALGAEFSVYTKTDTPTIRSDFYIFFGYVEATVKAAPGTGICSAVVLLSDDLDEIDWEWLGGAPNAVQSNYFGKGNTSSYDRAATHSVNNAISEFHTYAINWTSTSTQWLIDGKVVRTLNYADAVGGNNYPQSPCRISLGNWPAGSSSAKGTVEWAGGPPDYSQAPFTQYIKNIKVINYNPAESYQWIDRSGSFKSVKLVNPKAADSSSTSISSSSAPPPSSSPSSSSATSSSPPTTSRVSSSPIALIPQSETVSTSVQSSSTSASSVTSQTSRVTSSSSTSTPTSTSTTSSHTTTTTTTISHTSSSTSISTTSTTSPTGTNAATRPIHPGHLSNSATTIFWTILVFIGII